MTGLFNTIGHETEQQSAAASSSLHHQLARVHEMLASLELSPPIVPNGTTNEIADGLDQVADQYSAVATVAGAYRLAGPIDDRASVDAESARLTSQLEQFGYTRPMWNDDLPRIASAEVAHLAIVMRNARLQGRHSDWYGIRDILLAMNRLNDIGIIVSRLSALHGSDPQLRY